MPEPIVQGGACWVMSMTVGYINIHIKCMQLHSLDYFKLINIGNGEVAMSCNYKYMLLSSV